MGIIGRKGYKATIITQKGYHIIDFPKVSDRRGNLSFIEGSKHIPFEIKRAFYVYDIPSDESRGAHAHRTLHQVIICLSGGLDIILDDGFTAHTITLNRPWKGLYIPPLVWASQRNFDPGTVYIVLASDIYKEEDYYRNYGDFINFLGAPGTPNPVSPD